MLIEYRVKNNYIIDEMDLSDHDFKVRDLKVAQKNHELLVYNITTKRVQAVSIPTNHYWNGNEVEVDLNFNEEQKKFEAQKKLKEDIKRASLACIAYTNGWITDYDKESIDNWINYLKNKAIGAKSSVIVPSRPQILKDF
ncbi:MAG: hypothetical protein ACRCTS_10295 [Fusobacteriaceae bacterium]